MIRYSVSTCVLAACALALFSGEARAYIDPGTGSMLLQALLAGAVAAMVFGKRIYLYLQGLFRKDESEPGDNA